MKYLCLVAMLLLPSMLYAQESNDFRNVKWGMSREEVKATESDKPVHEDEKLVGYATTLDGQDVHLVYIFVDDKLARAKYMLRKDFTNKNDYYFQFFDPMKSLLIEKYGKPQKDDKLWSNELYKKDPGQLGLAISMGHLAEFVRWEKGNTVIIAYIHGNNYKIDTGVEYSSKQLGDVERQANKKKTLNNL